ncbi:streptophobe family protein, partial [Mangrovactinospora gilvigrisea]|uniref:streptophobe family protein n=1 Tax=Mangrovactinospora gilvigrisea TaxID=1428644 RepID=UPI001C31772B
MDGRDGQMPPPRDEAAAVATALVRGWLPALLAAAWALGVMGGVAALGLHLVGADKVARLLPMTAAVVVLSFGGHLQPSGDLQAFGASAGPTGIGLHLMPLGPTVAGALVLGAVFLRPLRRRVSVSPAELAVRAGQLIVVFAVLCSGVTWAAHDTITIDGAKLVPSGGLNLGGIDLGDLGKSLAGLAGSKASVGFRASAGSALLGSLVFALVVAVLAVLSSRRLPALRGSGGVGPLLVQRHIRPAVSAVVTVGVGAVAAAVVGGLIAAITGNGGSTTVGGVLLAAPNAAFVAVSLGMFVTWSGEAKGQLAHVVPAPLDQFLKPDMARTFGPGDLASLDGRVWLLPVAVAVMVLAAGVLAAARAADAERRFGPGGVFRASAGWVLVRAVSLGVVLAVAVPVTGALSGMKLDASVSVLGMNAVGAGLTLSQSAGLGVALGAVYG